MKKYFGTDGIRGQVGVMPITPEFVLRLGYAIGRVLSSKYKRPSILIGKDTRISGYLFESSLEAGLSYAGVQIYMAGPLPTPAVAYLTKTLHLCAGLVISASHNPYQDNGIKLFSNLGTKLDDEFELAIELALDTKLEYLGHLGHVQRLEDARGRYIEFCKSTYPSSFDLDGFNIVVDCANGSTYQIAPLVFKELGAKVTAIACSPDGLNINDNCGATNLAVLQQTVIQKHADLGIAFDGDGDRVIFIDSNGDIYNGDKLLYIILKYYNAIGKSTEKLVGTLMTNLAMEHALAKLGVELVRANVGDRYVLEQLKLHQGILGGEASGHILCLDKHSTGDGIISALQVLAAMRYFGMNLQQLINWQDYPQVLLNVEVKQDTNFQIHTLDPLIEQAYQELGTHGRVLVRASGTERVIRVMVEAQDQQLAMHWAETIANYIRSC